MNIERHDINLDDLYSDCDYYAGLLEKKIKSVHKSPANLGTLAGNARSDEALQYRHRRAHAGTEDTARNRGSSARPGPASGM